MVCVEGIEGLLMVFSRWQHFTIPFGYSGRVWNCMVIVVLIVPPGSSET